MTDQADHITEIRKLLGWSRERMGEELGQSRTWIWKIEEHHAKMTRDDADGYEEIVRERTDEDLSRADFPVSDILLASNWNLYLTRTVFEKVKSEDTSPSEQAKLLYDAHRTAEEIQQLDIPAKIDRLTQQKKESIEAAIQNLEAWLEKPTQEPFPVEDISQEIFDKVS